MEQSHLAFTVQVLVAPPVALLMVLLARALPRPFLRRWAAAWVALAFALVALRVAIVPLTGWAAPAVTSAYYCLEYLFGYLVWAGCRELVGRPGPRWADAWVLGPALAFGLIAPWVAAQQTDTYPFHAPVFGGFFFLALVATRGYRPATPQTRFGIHVVRFCLLVLGLLFVHYGPVSYSSLRVTGRPPDYMLISPMYDALAEVALAFGMALVAVEQVRDQLDAANRELAESNRQLALASDQLAVAARTDPLTGLLNRRAFDAMLAERAESPFAGSVAVVDLNDLKRINDTHGHAAGDAAIRLVARALRGHFRITDPVFRVGGDEFLTVMEGGRSEELSGRLDALDTSLRGVRLPGVAGPVDVVVAWGMSDFDTAPDLPAAVARADQAMYTQKARRKAPVG
ncbi:GGDEF domain-containing protein [bacterium]|nr:GGDEF domain-containing protein [bacterium]